MQKLKGISLGQNNISCSIIHHESNKIFSHFTDFSVIFYAIYKKQENGNTIGVTLLQEGPWKVLLLCNVAPGARWPARLAKIPARLAVVRPGKDGGGV
jgi:hypothetical protein